MCRVTFSSVACLTVPYFPTLSPKNLDYWKNVNEHTMWRLIFSTKFDRNISKSKKNYLDILIKVNSSSCRVSIILVRLNKSWIFSTDFLCNFKYQILRKSFEWQPGVSWWETDIQPDMNRIVAFRDSTKKPGTQQNIIFLEGHP
jgi:hypothetical protein